MFRAQILSGAGRVLVSPARMPISATSRQLSTQNQGKPLGNAPLYLSLAGLAGLSYYVYGESKQKSPSQKDTPQLVGALSKDEFVDFSLKRIEPYNHNTAKFTFALPENSASLLPVAACILVNAKEAGPKDDKGNPIIRPYTPISPSDTRGEIQLLVKKYDTGKLTPFIFRMKPGDKLGFKGPIPKIPYEANKWDEVAMISGGSGITPMYQILNHALHLKDDKTKFTLIFANVSPADILLREDLDSFKKQHPDRFNVVYVVDKAEGNWTGPTGHVNADLIRKHVPPPSAGEKVKILICGPPGQVKAISGPKEGMKQGRLDGTLKELGYTQDQVFKF
ncbi:uncharacterized protein EI90DRAFT_3046093 [Cantharellus anzutake]|uniref:uncharacterized protein n=1 Tax=Cantharellus anzutake TaxID=1750568 RepID=UPI0019084D9C|nr:uncharacterized protein EI90DRAFT_3046093 [Cantharellus anzutake]KAF8336538.1 hypothetical protein EI90DRAFT_3046093 [Cantharellus anzutake]